MIVANRTLTPGDTWNRPAPYYVPKWTKLQVFMLYDIHVWKRPLYVINHLVPLELNGTNSLDNLWPMPIWEKRHKSNWEAFLRGRVKAKLMTLQEAQEIIKVTWSK